MLWSSWMVVRGARGVVVVEMDAARGGGGGGFAFISVSRVWCFF